MCGVMPRRPELPRAASSSETSACGGGYLSSKPRLPCLVCAVLTLLLRFCSTGIADEAQSGTHDAKGISQSDSSEKLDTPGIEVLGYPVHGSFSWRSRWRFTDDEYDLDSCSNLSLDLGDPCRNRATAHFLLHTWSDIRPRREGRDYYAFDDLSVSHRKRLRGWGDTGEHEYRSGRRLSYGYLDIHRLPHLEKLRLGRQMIYETPEYTYFDGARVETEELKSVASIKLCAYGGLPVHPYESSPSGDSLVGCYADASPINGMRLRASFSHVEDRTRYGEYEDDHWGLSAWQNLGNQVGLHARYTRLNDNDGDVLLRATFNDRVSDFSFQAAYYQLFETKDDYSTEFDPYYPSLRSLHPYWRANLLLHKGWEERFVLEGGFELRRLKSGRDESEYNHSFRRFFAAVSIHDALFEDLVVSVNTDVWDTRDRSGDNWTVGGDLDYRLGGEFSVSLGTAYSLYKYDYESDSERDDIRTYYAKLRFWPLDFVMLSLGYDLEDDDFEVYHALKGEVRLTF